MKGIQWIMRPSPDLHGGYNLAIEFTTGYLNLRARKKEIKKKGIVLKQSSSILDC